LAEALLLSGYRTNCFSSNPNITPTFGFKQGFSEMQHDVFANADALITNGKQWLEAGGAQASFLYLHLNDAHYPYEPSADYAGMFNNTGIEVTLDGPTEIEFRTSEGASFSEMQVESLRLSYAEEIRYLDDLVGDFVNDLLQTRDDVIVIITADHGEEFLEHGDLGHGHTVYDELIRIPLQFNISESLMQQQQWLPGLHSQQVRQMDVLPTVLEICGVEWPPTAVDLDGQSLLPFFGNDSVQSDRSAISETDSQGSALSGFTGPLRAYRLPHAKLIVSDPWSLLPANRVWFFDLQADPREMANLAERKLEMVGDLFDDYKASGWLLPSFGNSSVTMTISEEEKLALAALGYGEDSEGVAGDLQDSYFDPRAVPWVELELSLD
jgi:arylsulfatase A-like enzyme